MASRDHIYFMEDLGYEIKCSHRRKVNSLSSLDIALLTLFPEANGII